jgi:hypothetical protein
MNSKCTGALKLSLLNYPGGSSYIQMVYPGKNHSLMLSDGLSVEESLRAEAQKNREKITQLMQQTNLYEQAAIQYEFENRHDRAVKETLYASTVADALERHLVEADTSVHWVKAPGEEIGWGLSRLDWPKDPAICFLFQEGLSEGSLVHVMQQLNPRAPIALQLLLTVKLLRVGKAAFEDAAVVRQFIEGMDVQKLLAEQSRQHPKAASCCAA